jgi:hypothetical protein
MPRERSYMYRGLFESGPRTPIGSGKPSASEPSPVSSRLVIGFPGYEIRGTCWTFRLSRVSGSCLMAIQRRRGFVRKGRA